MDRYSIGQAILEKLDEFGEAALKVWFPRKYSYTRIWRPLLGLERSRRITRKTVSTMLWRLKQQGLVEWRGKKRGAAWRLTREGKEYMRKAADARARSASDGITRIVAFDIPERERGKRDTIRAELVACDFRQLQKSVWIGECPLPQDFVRLLDDLNLAGKVHVFSVREKGTIDG